MKHTNNIDVEAQLMQALADSIHQEVIDQITNEYKKSMKIEKAPNMVWPSSTLPPAEDPKDFWYNKGTASDPFYHDVWRPYKEEQDAQAQIRKLQREVANLTKTVHDIRYDLAQKQVFIESLCRQLAIMVRNPEKMKQLEMLAEQYDQYIMLGRLVYGEDFNKMIKGLE